MDKISNKVPYKNKVDKLEEILYYRQPTTVEEFEDFYKKVIPVVQTYYTQELKLKNYREQNKEKNKEATRKWRKKTKENDKRIL